MNRRNFLRAAVVAPIAAPAAIAAVTKGYASGGFLSGEGFGVLGEVPSETLLMPRANITTLNINALTLCDHITEALEQIQSAHEESTMTIGGPFDTTWPGYAPSVPFSTDECRCAQCMRTEPEFVDLENEQINAVRELHPLQAITDAPPLAPGLTPFLGRMLPPHDAFPFGSAAIAIGGGLFVSELTKPSRTVIAFTGLIGAGKSEAARYLIERHGFKRGKFAAALKEMMRTYLRYRGVPPDMIERMIEGDLKEVPSPYLNGRTPRHAMQSLGTEWGRDCIHTDLWVDTEMDAQRAAPALVFDDARFLNEAAAVRAAGGALVRIERTGAGSAVGAGHSSEGQNLGETLTIHNDGTLAEFHAAIDQMLVTWSWASAATQQPRSA